MNLHECEFLINNTVLGLWPKFKVNRERNELLYKWFKPYRLEEVQQAIRDSFDAGPTMKAIDNARKRLREEAKQSAPLFKPADWTLQDENELREIVWEYRNAGKPVDELVIAQSIIGKNPTIYERDEAGKALDRLVDQAIERMSKRTKCTIEEAREVYLTCYQRTGPYKPEERRPLPAPLPDDKPWQRPINPNEGSE